MKTIKIIVWLLLVLVVIVVGGALVATNLIDPNDYKPQISKLVEEKTGRQLSLDGDLQLTFFPWVGVETGKVALSNAPGFGDQPMIEMDNAGVKVKLMPLLKKQVEVDTVVLDAPKIRLATLADGTTNWDDIIVKVGGEPGTSDPNAQGAGAIAGLAVQGVSINDGLVNWKNDQADQTLQLENLNLATGTLVPGDPLDIELSVDASGNVLPEPAAIKLDTTLTLSDNMESATLDSTALSVAMQSIKADAVMDKLSYAIQAGLAAITGLNAELEKDDIKSNLAVTSLNLNLSDQTLELPSVQISQDDASISASLSGSKILSEAPALKGNFDIKAADIASIIKRYGIPVELPQITLKDLNTAGSFQFENNVIDVEGFSLAALVNELSTSVELPKGVYDIGSASASIPGLTVKQDDFALTGSLEGAGLLSEDGSRTLSGQVEAQVADIASLLARNGVELSLPNIPLQNINLKTDFGLNGSNVKLGGLNAGFDHQQQPTTLISPAVAINLENGDLSMESLELNQGDFSLSASANGTGVTGAIEKMNLAGKLSAKTTDLIELLARNQIPAELPPGLVKSLDANLDFKVADNGVTVNQLKAKIDDMSVAGDIALTNLTQPGYRFDLAIDRLDLDKLLATGEQTEASTEKPSTGEQILLPVAPLQGLNVDGKARIGEFVTTGLTLKDVDITVKSDKNVLRVAPLTAKVFGGSIDSQLSYDVSKETPSVRMINKVTQVDVGALLKALDITNKIEGTGDLSTNLSGQGVDSDVLIASLDGDIGFQLLNGAIKGYDLQAALLKLEQQVLAYKGEATTDRATPEAETKFAELSGTFQVENGVLRNKDLAMKAPLFRVSGNGLMDLPKSRIDYQMDVNVVDSVEGQGGAALDELEGARVPLKVYGPLTDPSFTLDVAALVKDKAKEEIEKKLLEELDLVPEVVEGQDAAEPTPTDPAEALEEDLKKKLKGSLLKSLGLD
ncbi:MAG: AsmA family protein [bacterium]